MFTTLREANDTALGCSQEEFGEDCEWDGYTEGRAADGTVHVEAHGGQDETWEVRVEKDYKPRRLNVNPAYARNASPTTDANMKDVFIVNRTISGEYIDDEHETLGIFNSLQEANAAAPKLFEQGYEGLDWDEYQESFMGAGRIKIHAGGGELEYFDLEIQKQRQRKESCIQQ